MHTSFPHTTPLPHIHTPHTPPPTTHQFLQAFFFPLDGPQLPMGGNARVKLSLHRQWCKSRTVHVNYNNQGVWHLKLITVTWIDILSPVLLKWPSKPSSSSHPTPFPYSWEKQGQASANPPQPVKYQSPPVPAGGDMHIMDRGGVTWTNQIPTSWEALQQRGKILLLLNKTSETVLVIPSRNLYRSCTFW